VVAAFEQAEAQGLAAFKLDGEMIDYPVVERARKLLG
jgi:citrate lyase subunit beta/citryl-CoA lyase